MGLMTFNRKRKRELENKKEIPVVEDKATIEKKANKMQRQVNNLGEKKTQKRI